MRRSLTTLTLLALALPGPAFARGHFDPTTEFEQHEWVPIHLGPLNLSITKAVVYLMIGTVATLFYLFEVIIVVGIQAFIFAALSAIYIGSAIEPEH